MELHEARTATDVQAVAGGFMCVEEDEENHAMNRSPRL
jgi:hypothetical protein